MSMTFKSGNSTLKIETKGIDRAAAKIKGYGSINIKTPAGIKNYQELMEKLERLNGDATKAIQRAVRDAKKSAPGYVASEVRQVYNINAKDINKHVKSKGEGKVKLSGVEVENIAIKYEGRQLAPTARMFGLSPKTREQLDSKKKKEVKIQVKKGQTKKLPAGVFLGSNGSGTDIPFQREGADRLPIKSIKTLSVPQMVTASNVGEAVAEKVSETAKKRLDNYVKQLMK